MSPQSESDLMQIDEAEEDEAKRSGEALGSKRRFDEFECPTCSAYNPQDDFGNGDDLTCSYCGLSFLAIVNDEGKLKLRET